MMQMSPQRRIESLLVDGNVKLWSGSSLLDPILDPFSNKLAAEILLLDERDLIELQNLNFISATCSINDFEITSPKFLCYWDILEATIFMSLSAIKLQSAKAAESASSLCDCLAHHYEAASGSDDLDVLNLSAMIKDEIESHEILELIRECGIESGVASLKLAIDILNTHSRCLFHLGFDARSSILKTGYTLVN